MANFICKLKGSVTSEECYKCFVQQPVEKRLPSRVVCKQDNVNFKELEELELTA